MFEEIITSKEIKFNDLEKKVIDIVYAEIEIINN